MSGLWAVFTSATRISSAAETSALRITCIVIGSTRVVALVILPPPPGNWLRCLQDQVAVAIHL